MVPDREQVLQLLGHLVHDVPSLLRTYPGEAHVVHTVSLVAKAQTLQSPTAHWLQTPLSSTKPVLQMSHCVESVVQFLQLAGQALHWVADWR